MSYKPPVHSVRRFAIIISIVVFLYGCSRIPSRTIVGFQLLGLTFSLPQLFLDYGLILLSVLTLIHYTYFAFGYDGPPWKTRNVLLAEKVPLNFFKEGATFVSDLVLQAKDYLPFMDETKFKVYTGKNEQGLHTKHHSGTYHTFVFKHGHKINLLMRIGFFYENVNFVLPIILNALTVLYLIIVIAFGVCGCFQTYRPD